jgi:hypothetical protein
VTPCRLVDGYQHFRGTHCPHLQLFYAGTKLSLTPYGKNAHLRAFKRKVQTKISGPQGDEQQDGQSYIIWSCQGDTMSGIWNMHSKTEKCKKYFAQKIW